MANEPTAQKDGGLAFPGKRMETVNLTPHTEDRVEVTYPGMSLRDYFAAKAMQAFVEKLMRPPSEFAAGLQVLAADAYAMADAMLAVRAAEPPQ